MSEHGPSHQRFGSAFDVRVLAASLLAVFVVLLLVVRNELLRDETAVRDAGLALARTVVSLPLARSEAGTTRKQLQQLLDQQAANDAFAEGLIWNGSGEVARSGAALPVEDIPTVTPSAGGDQWVVQQRVELAGQQYLEFSGPVQLPGGAGGYRLRYYRPAVALSGADLVFLASISLPIFMLAPLCLLFMRREIDPLEALDERLRSIMAQTEHARQSMDSGLQGFVAQISAFMEHSEQSQQEAQREQETLVTSERFLHYRLNRFENLLRSLPVGLVTFDDTRSIHLVNARAQDLLGLNEQVLSGTRLSSLSLPGELEASVLQFERAGAEPSTEALPEPCQYQPAGTGLTIAVSFHSIRADAGGASGFVLLLQDATQEALAKLSRSEFVAHVSHELKSPLNTLSMCAENLKDSDDDQDMQREVINVISDEVERLAQLISNLLNVTQIEMGNLQVQRNRVRLGDLVSDAVHSVERAAAGRSLDFAVEVPDDALTVAVDKDLLRIAINNLLTNAVKYTDDGGRITVNLEDRDDAISIAVSDSGIGITPEDQAKIFDKFYRSEDSDAYQRGGQGLGLALAAEIVRLHHGSLRVSSEPGVGSTFTIDLWKHADVVQQAI